jgi:sulfite exporter TauE/SafE
MTLIASAFLVGLLGGIHCLAMCGGFIVACRAAATGGNGSEGLAGNSAVALVHTGRLLSYAGIGALAGGAGASVGAAVGFESARSALFVLANVTLLALGIYALRGTVGIPLLERAGARFAGRIGSLTAAPLRLAGRTHPALRSVMLGLAWGLVPCALIYSVLAMALFSGGPLSGALMMGALWAGTLPNVAAADWLLARARGRIATQRLRTLLGIALVAFATIGLYRALFAPHSALLEALCVPP